MPEIQLKQLKQIRLFSKLRREDLKAVASLLTREEVAAGQEICRQGQIGQAAYFVESGELRILHVNPQGLEQEVGRLGPGEYFGETSLLLGEPRDATVEAAEDATLLVLAKGTFDELLDQRPALLDALQTRPDVSKKLHAPRFKWQDADEVVVVCLHKHPATLIRQLFFPALVLLVGLTSLLYGILQPALLALLLGIPLTLVSLLLILYLAVDHLNDDYIVTNKRVVHEERVPLVRESRAEAPLYTVQDIQESQEGFLAQVFNYSDLIVETAGERGQVVFRQVPDPAGTRDAIFEQIRRVQSGARAEERAAIRQSMRRHFGIESTQREEPAAPSSGRRRFHLTMPAWLTRPAHFLRHFVPSLRYQQGDTITWRKHWIALIKPIGLPTLLILVVTLVVIWALSADPESLIPILIGYGTLMVFLLPWWIWRFDDWQNDLYQVTSTRIIDIERLPFYLREERREASLDKIQNTKLEIPGFLGKLLDYGSVTIETAGTEPFTFEFVKDPRGVQAEITRRVEAYRRQQRQEEAERHRAELLDWFSVYDQMHRLGSHEDRARSRQEEA